MEFRKNPRKVMRMEDSRFIRAIDVAKDFEISEGMAYRIIKRLNNELKAKGYITVAGRVNRQYYIERTYESMHKDQNEEAYHAE